MKRVLLTVIAALAMCGSMRAQSQYESYWPGFDYHAFEMQGGFVAAIKIDGQIINVTDANWDALEVAFFVGDECRGNENYLFGGYVEEYGDPFPILDGYPIYYDIANAGELVTFKMYDHLNGVLYEDYELIYDGEPLTVYTGEEHFEGWDDPENPIYLCFTSPGPVTQTFTKSIIGYASTEGNGSNWYLIASPIGEVAPGDVDGLIQDTVGGNDYDLYWFDQTENGQEWRNNKAEAIQELVPGMGYLYASKQNTTLTFTGTPIEGDSYDVSLVYDEDAALPGWNLIGNPFAESGANLGGRPYYVMNEEGTGFIACNTNRAGGGGGELVVPGDLQPMEGAFVIAEYDGENLTITKGDGELELKDLTLNISKAYTRGTVDRAIICFDEGRTLPKLQLNPNSTKVYIPQDGNDYAVVRASEMGEMPVNFKAEKNGTYTMSFSSENVSFAYLHLIDNLTGADVDVLANPSYTFEATTADYASRFRLVFVTGDNTGDNFAFYSNGSFVINNEGEATLQVVDVTGRVLSSETISGCASVSVDAARGVYMLRLINGNDMKVQKVVVE